MKFTKGHPKLGGRKKGTPHKANRLFREVLEDGLGKPMPERVLELIKLHPERELDTLLQLLPYCYCKMAPMLLPMPLSAEEQALKDRQMGLLSQALDDDPNSPRAG